MTPVQKPVNAVASWFYNLTHYFGDVDALKTENEALRDENAQLEKQLRDLDRLEEENRRLVEMLDLKDTHTEFTLTAARVIAKDPSNWYSTFTIDKGTADGLQIKQPVITAQENLVGQITRIGSNWAEVTTVLDPANAVGSAVQRSRDIGIVEGDGDAALQRGSVKWRTCPGIRILKRATISRPPAWAVSIRREF